MRVLFLLAGLHRIQRGAEVVFESVAAELGAGGDEVTLIGSGQPRPDDPYRFIRIGRIARDRFERWPSIPFLRNAPAYEGLTAVPSELLRYRPRDFDVTITCGYPYENLVLRRPVFRGSRPAHVFVTQNGDWPAYSNRGEYRLFSCDGLVCTNPEYYERNRERWHSTLVPNGVDTQRFLPGTGDRQRFGLTPDVPLVAMVSALDDNKRVLDAMRAVAPLDGVHMVVAGDGPLRAQVDELAASILPGRFRRVTLQKTEMPELYRCADAFVHTAVNESFGNVYIEALASGLPIVAHDTPTTKWILGDDARLIDTFDSAALTAAIDAALAADRSEAAQRSRSAAERFGWPSVAAQYRAHLQSTLDRQR